MIIVSEVIKIIKLDYSLETPEERNALVQKILEENPNPSDNYLEILADYLILCMEKQERKERQILTENRLSTINKREMSFEGLTNQLENGEDGIYNLITENKYMIFQPKISITKQDIETIPHLKQLREAIQFWEEKLKTASGRDAFIIKKTLIELRKDQYVIKNFYKKPIIPTKIVRSKYYLPLEESITFDEDGYCIPEGISLLDPKVCSAILCNYSKLKQDSWGEHNSDIWYLLYDFDNLCDLVLKDYPLYEKIVECKIDGLQNAEIQEILKKEFNITHSLEYISSLWRNKIPNLIASKAEDLYLDYYYTTKKKGTWKKCSRCGQIKLAHNKYFSRNKTSRDGFYSICKACRNTKKE